MANTISQDEARRFYDRFGARQDWQGFYEDQALELMIELGNFAEAENVFELGCGTGRLAGRLLSKHLPAAAHYVGVDLSSTMVRLAKERLTPYAGRATVELSDGTFEISRFAGPFDRFVSTYVLDLLSLTDIQKCLAAAHVALAAEGLFCHCGLTRGTGPISQATSAIWTLLHRAKPMLVGGCRPLQLVDLISVDQWQLLNRQVVVSAGVPSEIVIAKAR